MAISKSDFLPVEIIAAGAISCLLAVAGIAGAAPSVFASMTWYVAPLPLFYTGLGRGVRPVTLSALVGLAGVLLFQAIQKTFSGALTAYYLLTIAVPTVVIVRQALLFKKESGAVLWYPTPWLFSWVVGFAIGITGVFAASTFGLYGGEIDPTASQELKALVASHPEWGHQMERIFLLIQRFSPGIIGISWLVTFVLNGAYAQYLLGKRKKNLRVAPKMGELDAENWMLFALALSGGGALWIGAEVFSGYLFGNLALGLLGAFAILGLGTVHVMCSRYKNASILLGIVYVMIVVLNWFILALILLGIFEPWLKLRSRFLETAVPPAKS